MRKRVLFYGFAVFLSAMLGVSACGGSSRSSQTAVAMTEAAYENMAAAESAAGTDWDDSAQWEGAADKAGVTDTASLGQAIPPNRKLIRNVTLSVETDAFDQMMKTLTDKVGELGGYVEQSDISGNSLNYQNELVPRYASLTVRVPIDRLDGFVSTVEANGNITNKSENTQDVTLQYSDLESRKKSLSVEQERIWALLEKADTLEAVIALEERLSEIRYQLESMESQLRLYDNQVDYSTVYLDVREIREAASFTPTEPEGIGQRIEKGFTKNLNAVSRGATGFLIWFLAASPIWLPLAVIVILILLILRRSKRRMQERLKSYVIHDEKEAEDTKE